MSTENVSTLLTVLTVFTGVVALVLLIQGIALLVIYRRFRELSARMESLSANLMTQVESLAAKVDGLLAVVKNTAEKAQTLQENVAAIAAIVNHSIVAVDTFLTEAAEVGRLQMAKFQDILDTTSRKIEETIDTLHGTVLMPIVEIQALIRGIRTGLDVLFGRRKLAASRVQHDEEMFI